MAYVDYRLAVTGSANKLFLKISELKPLLGMPVEDVSIASQEDLDRLVELVTTLQEKVSNTPDPVDLSFYVKEEQLLNLLNELEALKSTSVDLVSLLDVQVERIQNLENFVNVHTSSINTLNQNITIVDNNTKALDDALTEVAESIPNLSSLIDNFVDSSVEGLIQIGKLKLFILETTSNSDGVFTADYTNASFSTILFQSATAYADVNYAKTGASNFACLYKETETLNSVQGIVKGAEGVGLLVGTVLVDSKNARVKVITVGF